MSERRDLPRVKPKDEPTIFNHEAGKWGYISGIASSLVTVPMAFKMIVRRDSESSQALARKGNLRVIAAFALGIELVGALIGGIAGKKKQEQEQVEGRVVETPSYWNKGILTGGLVSSIAMDAYVLATGRILGGFKPTLIGLGAMAAGSILRNNQLERDYNTAVHMQQQKQQAQQELIQQLLQERSAEKSVSAPVVEPKLAEIPQPVVQKDSVQHDTRVAEAPEQEIMKA